MQGDFAFVQLGDLQYLKIPAFAATGLVSHGFSTRLGGVSTGIYASLNLGLSKDDRRENVLENRRRFLQALGLDLADLVAAQQVHGTRVAVVTARDRGRGGRDSATEIPSTDALITAERGIALSAYFADCVPLFFLDPQGPAISLAHAGWKGTVAAIGQKTLARMGEEFGTEPSRCLVAIGPSIGPCCYEVDGPVLEALAAAFPYWRELVTLKGGGKGQLDLWETNRRQLMEMGVKEENIYISRLCTACNERLFFSYRAHNKRTGSLAAVMSLK